MDPTQKQNLERVSDRIAGQVKAFLKHRVDAGQYQFTMADLQGHVSKDALVAPDSPSRILRLLRQSGEVKYVVENRRASLYRVLYVQGRGATSETSL